MTSTLQLFLVSIKRDELRKSCKVEMTTKELKKKLLKRSDSYQNILL